MVGAYYAALVVAWRASRVSVRLGSCALVVTIATSIVFGVDPLWRVTPHALMTGLKPRPAVRLTMIDVGQGEAILLEASGAQPLLIDAGGAPFGGGAFDIGARVLAPALWARGVRTLGELLVTHGDPDHIGGAPTVLAEFRPGLVWWGIPVPPHLPSRTFLEAAGRASRVQYRRAGETLAFGRARLRVLNPPEPDWERQRVRNDDSVVLEVTFGDVAILLAGDISATVERSIASQLTPARVRVLKVAHHGSRTSTSDILLNAWRPQITLISCGRGNTFGHPALEVLDRLKSIGAQVYRTDQDGEITLTTDGRDVSVRTFVGGVK